ncbi:hypothetical protein NVP1278O_31 [Vibrio phage 1.278.O._10N.286.54.E8]|nr:hypothetical protein NVP1278O_31 [Vibrio phage 1.278.O._10N.286.54.E8]
MVDMSRFKAVGSLEELLKHKGRCLVLCDNFIDMGVRFGEVADQMSSIGSIEVLFSQRTIRCDGSIIKFLVMNDSVSGYDIGTPTLIL